MPSSTDPPADRLHDGAQQSITAVRLLADGALAALRDGDVAGATAALERLGQAADQAATQIALEVERLRAAPVAAIAVVGQSGWDVVSAPGLDSVRRIGGAPRFAARALAAAGATPVVVVKGVPIPEAVVTIAGTPFQSVLVHSEHGTEQELAAVGDPFTVAEIEQRGAAPARRCRLGGARRAELDRLLARGDRGAAKRRPRGVPRRAGAGPRAGSRAVCGCARSTPRRSRACGC